MSLVSLVKTSGNMKDSIKKAVDQSLNLIGYRQKQEIKNVVIKPNLCYYWDYSTGQTTDPKFVAALIEFIRENISSAADIYIVESDASAMKCRYSFRMLGYNKLAEQSGVKLFNLSEDQFSQIRVTAGAQKFDIKVPQIIQRADLKINVPKIKYTMEPIKLTCVKEHFRLQSLP